MLCSVSPAPLSSSSGLEQSCSLYFVSLGRVQSSNYAGDLLNTGDLDPSLLYLNISILEEKNPGLVSIPVTVPTSGRASARLLRQGESVSVMRVRPSVHPLAASGKISASCETVKQLQAVLPVLLPQVTTRLQLIPDATRRKPLLKKKNQQSTNSVTTFDPVEF